MTTRFVVLVSVAMGGVAIAACTSTGGGATSGIRGEGGGSDAAAGATSSTATATASGAGGATSGATAAVTTGDATSAAAGTGNGGTGGGAGDCIYCADAFDDAESPFCDLEADDLYTALTDCLCVGNCSDYCVDNLCQGYAGSVECLDCMQTPGAGGGCKQELDACMNDVS